MAAKSEYTMLEVAGHEVRLSNPGKVYFPKPGWTKLDWVVADRARGQCPERQRIPGDDPLQLREADPQVLLDCRQRDVHHGVVEHDHEEAERDGRQRPPLPPLL